MSVLPIGVVGLFEGVSFDGGLTWTRQIIGAGDNLGDICCDQQLAWDSFGNLWMVYLFSGTNGNVPIALSTDGGLTWEKVAEIAPAKVKGHAPKNAGSKGNPQVGCRWIPACAGTAAYPQREKIRPWVMR